MDRIKRKLGFQLTFVLAFVSLGLWANLPQAGEYAVFSKDNKKGLKERDRVVIPAQYQDLGWSSGTLVLVDGVLGYKENGLWGLINLKNKKIISPHYSHLLPFRDNLVIAAKYDHQSQQNLFGIIDIKGHQVLALNYEDLKPFNELLIAAKTQAGQRRYGLLNEDFDQLINYIYDAITPLQDQYAAVSQHGKLGVINKQGQIVVNPKYQDIQYKNGVLRGKPFSQFELKTSTNKFVAAHQAESITPINRNLYLTKGKSGSALVNTLGTDIKSFANSIIFDFSGNGLAVIEKEHKFGLVNEAGSLLLPLEYDTIWVDQSYIGLKRSNLNWILMNDQLVRVSQKDYQQIDPGSEGLFPMKRHGSWGFMNTRGVEVIPPQYEAVKTFQNGLAQARYGGSWGMINREGDWVIRPRYQKISSVDDRRFLVHDGREVSLFELNRGVLYTTKNRLTPAGTALLEESSDGLKGLVSLGGEPLLSTQYSSISHIEHHPQYFLFRDSVGPGLYQVERRFFLKDPIYQEMRPLHEEFVGVKINNQYGFIDLNGKLRIANRYENIGHFSETMSPIKIRGKWGYVDRLERLKIQPIYEEAGVFEEGTAIVAQNQRYGVVNKQGKVLIPLQYDRIERMPNQRFRCFQKDLQGLVNVEGKVLIRPKYHSFQDLGNGFVIVERAGKYSLISDQGVSIIPMIYDGIVYDTLNDLYIIQQKKAWETIKL